MDFIELISHIEKIFDENDNEVSFSKIELKTEKRLYSKTFSTIMYIDNVPLTGKQMKTFYVQYLCRCNRHIKILLHKYINKKLINCIHCLQDRSFDEHTKTYPYSLKNGTRQRKLKQNKTFDEYSNEFKELYKHNHLSEEEFFSYLPIIKKVNNIQIENLNLVKYKYYDKVNNQSKFSSKVSVDNGKNFYTLKSITLKCSVCGKEFNIHPNNIRLQNIDHPLCRYCKFNNLTFPIRKYNDSLTYQSLPELKFIELCIENDIQILNGFEIPYYFNKKDRTYVTDFYLPEFKYIIEIKSMNPYYKDDLSSGKAEAKGAAAVNFGKQYGMKYKLVFDYDVENFINILKEKQSLTIL